MQTRVPEEVDRALERAASESMTSKAHVLRVLLVEWADRRRQELLEQTTSRRKAHR